MTDINDGGGTESSFEDMLRDTARLATRLYKAAETAPEGAMLQVDAGAIALVASGFLMFYVGITGEAVSSGDDSPAQFH